MSKKSTAKKSTAKPEVAQEQDAAREAQASEKKGAVSAARKVTVASIFGKIRVADIPEGGALKIGRIAGVASSIVEGESNYGPWEMLIGEFAATNAQTGEIFAAKKAIVPGAMGEQLVIAMRNALAEDANSRLRFAVDIFAKVSPRDENKYEYIVRPVLAPDVRNEAMALLTMEG